METKNPEIQARTASSSNWTGKTFQNINPLPEPPLSELLSKSWDFFFNKPEGGSSGIPLPAEAINLSDWSEDRELQLAWIGHSTLLIKIEAKWVITDPIFSEKAGSFGWFSPGRYSELPIKIEDLPRMDAVIISHDHYDHLDKSSIKALAGKARRFIVPLGVGKYLESWGIARKQITELDWWEETNVGHLSITATPSRHFSGRGLFDRNETLWASYAIKGHANSVFFGGDSGWHEQLYEIGEKLGPFDVTLFEMGAYGNGMGWEEIHMTPEQAVKAHQAVNGKIIVPIHWGTFDLALHKWYEPIERFIKAAAQADAGYLTPKPGERINPGHLGGNELWWKQYRFHLSYLR